MRRLHGQSGFTAFEGILVVLVVAVLAVIGHYIISHRLQDMAVNESKVVQTSTQAASNTSGNKTSPYKTYSNTQYKFSFTYPTTWQLTTKLQNAGRGGSEGDIYVTSPNGTKVHFGPNFGGKGGDCWDVEANAHTTRTCDTWRVLSVKLLADSGSKKIWFIEGNDTAPLINGGKTKYFVYLTSHVYDARGNLVAPTIGSKLGAYGSLDDDVSLDKVSLSVYVEGKNDAKNNSSAFFNSNEVKEAIPVLESFKANT